MKRVSFRGMGTTIAVHSTAEGVDAAKAAFAGYEERFSRFLPHSEISRINESHENVVNLSPDFAAIMAVASDLRDRTDGLVDVGVGAAVIGWGYAKTFAHIEGLDRPPRFTGRPSWWIDGTNLHRASNTAIDLGGIAKGWVCDRVVESGLTSVASAGGDIRSQDPSLVVDVIDGHGEVAAEMYVGQGALATSSITERRWKVADRFAHHVIDPRTMNPAITPVVSATVVANTAAEAEAGAKAVLVRGVDGLAWADAQPWIRQAVAVWHDEQVYSTTVARAS